MRGEKWSKEHKDLLKTDMTTEQIAEVTGRTPDAVRRARYVYTGHSSQKDRCPETYEEKLFEAERKYLEIQREQRIKDLCRQLGVRIGGMYE